MQPQIIHIIIDTNENKKSIKPNIHIVEIYFSY